MADRRWFFHSWRAVSSQLVGTSGAALTHVIQAPLFFPNAICHAGSSDWKYSSGWKKVRIVRALSIRNATRNRKISSEWATCFTALGVVGAPSSVSFVSLPTFVEACDRVD